MVLLAGWQMVLGKYSGQKDVAVGTPMAGRRWRETEELVGLFVNTLVLRTELNWEESTGEMLGRVRETVLEGYEHQDVPFEKLVEELRPERDLSRTPLFQVMFVVQSRAGSGESRGLELGGLKITGVEATSRTEKFEMTLAAEEKEGKIGGELSYRRDLYEESSMRRLVSHYENLLGEMVRDAQRPVGQLAMLNREEREQVVYEWNRTEREYPREQVVQELFEAQVERTPAAVAVVYEEEKLTYAELNRRANQLAHYLRGLGVKSDTRVGVLLERSMELVEAELAIVKCGAAYVPIDPSDPEKRKAFMISDSGAKIVLSVAKMEWREIPGVRKVDIDGGILDQDIEDGNPEVAIGSESLAYIMYTSGSTGQPKGVMVPHRAITRLVLNSGYAKFERSDRVAFAANPEFDATTLEVWAPLLNGGRIVVIDQAAVLDPVRFGRTLKRHGVNILWLTVGLFNQYAEALGEEIAGLKYLIIGGDRLDPGKVALILQGHAPQHLLNGYGPTETTTFALTHEITMVADQARSIPIGRPIANTRVYILDGQGEPVPVGVVGELYIGGAGVACGYLNRPDLTAERFLQDRFGEEPGGRMYKTGDLGHWLEDGTVEFVGRNDFQVKIRGYRVELGEIEARLAEHAGVGEAVVVVREDDAGGKRLVGYVVKKAGAEVLNIKELRSHLKERLPEYMVPSAWVELERLPLSSNGKIDRKSLPKPEATVCEYVRPRSLDEETLCVLWQDVLKRERIGIHDNFFELGGHSLLATQVVSRIPSAFAVELPVRALFESSTVAELVVRINERKAAASGTENIPNAFVRKELTTEQILASLETLSEDEVELLLNMQEPS
jgi:amino acid adenylation domain-containing protein